MSSFNLPQLYLRGPGSSVGKRLTTGWTLRDRIPVGTRFSSHPDRPWGPHTYRVFPGGKVRPGRWWDIALHISRSEHVSQKRKLFLFIIFPLRGMFVGSAFACCSFRYFNMFFPKIVP